MRINKLQSENSIEKKIKGFVYKIEKVSDGVFLISKMLDEQIISEYLVELQGFCSCSDFQKRRVKSGQVCKHIQLLLLALAKDPEFEQGIAFFDESLKKLL